MGSIQRVDAMFVEPINHELRNHQVGAAWDHTEQFQLFHLFFDYMNVRCFADQPLPPPAISAERSRRRRELGFYQSGRDGFGFCHRINISAQLLAEGSMLRQLATLGHELCHQWQQIYGHPPRTGWYHDRAWCDKAQSIGIIAERGKGYLCGLTDPFVSICRELGVDDPVPNFDAADGDVPPRDPPPPGKSTLSKWVCACTPTVNIWVGRAVVRVRCEECESQFHRAER